MRADSRAIWVTSCCLMFLFTAVIFSIGRTVWMDEAMLARNLFSKSFVDLLHPLDYEQSAPILYLLLAKCAISVYSDDIALRILSLMVGVGTVCLFSNELYNLGIRRTRLVLLVSVLVTNNYFIRYSTEIKPYIFDLAASICIPSILNGRNKFIMAIAVVIFPWLSNGSVFIIAASIAVYLLFGTRTQRLDLMRVGICFVCSCTLLYVFVIRDHPYKTFMYQYWLNDGGLYQGGSLFDTIRFVYRGMRKVGDLVFGDLGPYMTVASLLGCILLSLRSLKGKIILTQVTLQLTGAMVGFYPFAHRLLLGVIPIGVHCLAYAMLTYKARRVQVGIAGVCFVLVTYSLFNINMNRPSHIDSLPISQISHVFQESGTPTYVSLGASNTIKYYCEVGKLKMSDRTSYGTTQNPLVLLQESAWLGSEFFVIHTHPSSADEMNRLISDFKAHGFICIVSYQTETSLIMKCRARR
jgi:hypothetical protein